MTPRPCLFLILWAAGSALLSSTGCSKESPAAGVLAVTVSIPPQAYVVERIGGPDVRVTTLVQPGESPTTYQPTDLQVSEVLRSRVYFKIGVPFERGKWAQALLDERRGIRIVDMREGITLRDIASHSHGPETREGSEPPFEGTVDHGAHHEGADPHIWLAPELLKIQARTVAATLIELAPALRDSFRQRLDVFLQEMDRTHRELQRILKPCRGKSLFVYHPAWGYFCDAYGLVQAAVESEGKAPSDQDLTRLQERLRAEGAGALFVQPQIAGSSARAVADAVQVALVVIDPLARELSANLLAVAKAIAKSYR